MSPASSSNRAPKPGCLQGSGHSATPADGVTDAADLFILPLGDGGFKCLRTLVQICHDSDVNLLHRRRGHHSTELGQRLRADSRLIKIEARRLAGCGYTYRASQQFIQRFRAERLEQKSIGGGANLFRRVAAADNDNACLGNGAQLIDEFDVR